MGDFAIITISDTMAVLHLSIINFHLTNKYLNKQVSSHSFFLLFFSTGLVTCLHLFAVASVDQLLSFLFFWFAFAFFFLVTFHSRTTRTNREKNQPNKRRKNKTKCQTTKLTTLPNINHSRKINQKN